MMKKTLIIIVLACVPLIGCAETDVAELMRGARADVAAAQVTLNALKITAEDLPPAHRAKFDAKIDEAQDVLIKASAALDNAKDTGDLVSEAGKLLSGYVPQPWGSLILLGTGLAGWLIKRPGEASRLAKEKEASYNAGIKLRDELDATGTIGEHGDGDEHDERPVIGQAKGPDNGTT